MANIILPGEERGLNRRSFLKVAGFGAAALATISVVGCEDEDEGPTNTTTEVTLGTGDTGILNYAYALEQLEADFYIKAVAGTALTGIEKEIFTQIRDHEIAHRDFFKAALKTNAIKDLEFNYTGVDFNNRLSVLNTAKTLEDTGVLAYNGAGQYLSSGDFLLTAGKIVSVEARHAAAIRAIISPNTASFAGDDVVDPATGFDKALKPSEVLAAAGGFFKTKINSSLP
jgi:hypothetical protein